MFASLFAYGEISNPKFHQEQATGFSSFLLLKYLSFNLQIGTSVSQDKCWLQSSSPLQIPTSTNSMTSLKHQPHFKNKILKQCSQHGNALTWKVFFEHPVCHVIGTERSFSMFPCVSLFLAPKFPNYKLTLEGRG